MTTGDGQGPDVFIVGPRWYQHSGHSGYEAFHPYVGAYLPSPVTDRWTWKDAADKRVVSWARYAVASRVSRLVERLTKATYSVPIMRIELAAARHMRRRRGAVYHVLYGETDVYLLGRIGRRTGNPVVASFHDGQRVLEWCGIDERVLATLDAAVLLGETQRPYFEARMPADRVFVVPHGVDADYFRPDPSMPRERVCITVGGHTRDHETLAAAIRLVQERDPSVRFVAVSTHIGHKGAPLDVPGVEYLTGIPDDELLRRYRSASLAMFSFEWAVANNSLLEAMSCGLPIVATDVGGVREYLPADAGIVFPQRDPVAMADAMLRILDDQDLAARMGAAARARAELTTYRHVADQLQQVYRIVAERRSARPPVSENLERVP